MAVFIYDPRAQKGHEFKASLCYISVSNTKQQRNENKLGEGEQSKDLVWGSHL